MAAPFGRDTLPEHWSYGVCKDGRVFFIDDETRTTTWLHPRTSEPVNSGHMIRSDLPRGWEEGFAPEGASYFINHNQRSTTYWHPVTGQLSPENAEFLLQDLPPVTVRMSALQPPQTDPQPPPDEPSQAPCEPPCDATQHGAPATANHTHKSHRSSSRVYSFGKREQSIKRNPNVPVVVRGWLYKQDSSGLRLWKRKWFVLADYCLFYYKDSREEAVLGSIPLPSYVIAPVDADDHISRKFAFKASHTGMRSYIYSRSSLIGSQAEHGGGMRTYYFSADTQEDMSGWIRAMNQAALMQTPNNHGVRVSENLEKSEYPITAELDEPDRKSAEPQTNHVTVRPLEPASMELELEAPANGPLLHMDPDMELASQEVDPLEVPSEEDAGKVFTSRHHITANEEEVFMTAASDSRPPSRAPSRGPSRGASSSRGPPSSRCSSTLLNGSLPEVNGIAGAVEEVRAARGAVPVGVGVEEVAPRVSRGPTPRLEGGVEARRKSTLEQVEHWVKVQKDEQRATLTRRPKSTQPVTTVVEVYHANPAQSYHPANPPQPHAYGPNAARSYQTLPKTPPSQRHLLPSDYKYAHDRLSHFRLTHGHPPAERAGKDNTVWRLYEWQQRQRYRHASPTAPLYNPSAPAPLYNPSPDYPGPRLGYHPSHDTRDKPRSIPMPPSLADIPPPGPPRTRHTSPRRPHTPADRVTVRPLDQRPVVEVPPSVSPRRHHNHKSATVDRRSMPPSGYITHTVSAPSLYGKTADDTYVQLKKDLEYLDLKVVGTETLTGRSGKAVKVAESDVDVQLSRLCEQDKILQELQGKISALKEDKDKLESVLDMSRQQMEQYKEQPSHADKIACQQRLLQEDVVHIRAEISWATSEMERSWLEYCRQEECVLQLQEALQGHMELTADSHERSQMKRELWRIEDVMAGLSTNKANYKITINSVQNPERKLAPSVPESTVPSRCVTPALGERSSRSSPTPPDSNPPSQWQPPPPNTSVPTWDEEHAPPRPPLPLLYDSEETPPAVPPLPREATGVIRHTSVRGLKRQSDGRKRDREGHYPFDNKVELRSYLSEPELAAGLQVHGEEDGLQTLTSRVLSGSSSRIHQTSHVSSFVTMRKGSDFRGVVQERPKSALERLYGAEPQEVDGQPQQPPQPQQTAARSRMSAEEQLERMKRHQRALVRERKRNLSQGDRLSNVSTSTAAATTAIAVATRPLTSDPSVAQNKEQDLDSQLADGTVPAEEEQQIAPGRASRDITEPSRDITEPPSQPRAGDSDGEWLTVLAVPMKHQDIEPVDFEFDISRELAPPPKVPIPRRYVDLEEESLTTEELEERQAKAEKIKNLLAKSSGQGISSGPSMDTSDLDSALQQRERIVGIPRALASEASIKIKQAAAARASLGQ
ncbi:pleckstrin homology domain-containing family A member 7-like isoform X3 [Engraulis encrasicolus]|uniref:pleckstrin homology domain-containing family A member 7-like isoform X3 n=1 Tax=Engraulis encrasicolus TaxID=184585 RepID=UPI002FD694D2